MTVMIYNEGDHAAGFIGIRVVRSVGGEYRQKYYKLRNGDKTYVTLTREKQLIREAKALDKVWEKEQIEHTVQYRANNIFKDHGATKIKIGVYGIRPHINIMSGHTPNQKRFYYTPAFAVKIPGGGKGAKLFYPGKLGYFGAWRASVDYLCKIRALGENVRNRLLALPPDRNVFDQVRKRINKDKQHHIPKSQLKKWRILL